jgi:hypothetical protein
MKVTRTQQKHLLLNAKFSRTIPDTFFFFFETTTTTKNNKKKKHATVFCEMMCRCASECCWRLTEPSGPAAAARHVWLL